MAGLDLSAVGAVVNQWLLDEATVTRPAATPATGDLDPDTGQIVPPAPVALGEVACAVQDLSLVGGLTRMDDDPATITAVREWGATHRVLVRSDLPDKPPPDVQVGDVVTVTKVGTPSASAHLPGARFRVVREAGSSSFHVVQFWWVVAL